MSGPKWTPAQRAAIDDRGGSLLVSAAAGSGKTAVLTERAVRLITDPERPVDADRLLIVTFTNAAAAELRARIGQALLRRSQAESGNTALRRQRMLLQRAPICTIDAFCLDLLHKHFQALDIPPDFAPADPGSVEVLRAAALSETLENAYRDPDFCAFADLYGKGRTDKPAGDTILHVYDFLRSLPDYDRRLDEYLAPWQQENGFDATCWHDLLLAEAARCAKAARELLTAALADCRADFALAQVQAEEKGKTAAAKAKAVAGVNDKFAEPLFRLENAAALLGEVERLARAGEWTPLYDRLTPYVLGMEEAPGLKGMKKRLTGEHKAAVKTRAEEAAALFEQITELISCSEEEAEADRKAALPRLRALFDAVRDFDARFAARKKERKLLEFSDFEHFTLRLLRGPDGTPTELCRSIRQNYAAVMVDEYQDTNALQDAIYRCLASPVGDNLFLVGDLKQSIYRFRQADPSIFRAKLNTWLELPGGTARPRPAEGTPGADALLALDANFRSAPQVVAGINFIFEQLMTPQLGDTAYGDGQRLVCGAPSEYAGSVEAQFLPDDTAETDAAWIAGRIEELVKNGEPVRDGAGTRPVQYEDCCILLAARGDFLAYEEALTARGIPVYADARENLMTAPHIRPLISLLRVIDNPAQDIYLAAAMLGPMFGFTDDDLVRLRAYSEQAQKQQETAAPGAKHARMSLYGAVLQVVQSEDETPFTQKVKMFYDRLTELRRMARSAPAEQLMEEIFVSTGYLAALGAMENGARRREDARRFAAFCAASGANGISALVRAIDAAAQAGSTGQDTVPGGSRPGCVTIMTIHRSKGLQFPVVFVGDTARRFNAADTRQPVLLHRKYGAGLRLRPEQGEGAYKTAAYTALSNVHAQEMRSEQMRLLYVALTRAQDKLILTVPLGISKSTNPLAKAAAFLAAGAGETLHQQANSFADWLRAALLVHPFGGPLRRQAGGLDQHHGAGSSAGARNTGNARRSAGRSRSGGPGAGGSTAGGLCVAVPGGTAGRGASQGERDQHRAQGRADHAGTARLPLEGRPDRCRDGHGSARLFGARRLCRPCGGAGGGCSGRSHCGRAAAAGGCPAGGPGDRRKAGRGPHPPLCGKRSLCENLCRRQGAAGDGLHHGAACQRGDDGAGCPGPAGRRRAQRTGFGAGHRGPCAGICRSSGAAGLQDRPPQDGRRLPARLPCAAEPLRPCHRQALCPEKGDL